MIPRYWSTVHPPTECRLTDEVLFKYGVDFLRKQVFTQLQGLEIYMQDVAPGMSLFVN